MGLEPLAKKMMSFPTNGSMEVLASGFPCDVEKAIEGAKYIIAEWISDNAYYRKYIKREIWNHGFFTKMCIRDRFNIVSSIFIL